MGVCFPFALETTLGILGKKAEVMTLVVLQMQWQHFGSCRHSTGREFLACSSLDSMGRSGHGEWRWVSDSLMVLERMEGELWRQEASPRLLQPSRLRYWRQPGCRGNDVGACGWEDLTGLGSAWMWEARRGRSSSDRIRLSRWF